MKLALLISGYLRLINENIYNLKKNIIQDNECDIYIHITIEENNMSDVKYCNKNISLDFIRDELNPKIILISKNIKFVDNYNILNQNYKFYWLNKEMNKLVKIENIKYDIIIKIRPDVNILNKINLNIESNKLYIPRDSKIDIKKLKNINDKYICDTIAYGSIKIMNIYFNYYIELNKLIKKYKSYVNENLLYYYLKLKNIKYELVDIDYIILLSLCNTIAITGDSGSGKTIISNILKDIFKNSFILECDRYHKWERNNEQWTKYTHLDPNANYITKMHNDVFDLKIGKNIYQIDYDHKNGKFTDKKLIESKENIIVCGLHCLYLPKEILNLKIYMDTDDNLRIPWKIKRDIQNRDYSIDKIIKQIKYREEDFIKFIYPQKKEADIIISLFTDKVFDINNFSIDDDIKVYLKIGVRETYNINKLNTKNFYKKIIYNEYESFVFIYFEDINDYDNIIKTIVLNYY